MRKNVIDTKTENFEMERKSFLCEDGEDLFSKNRLKYPHSQPLACGGKKGDNVPTKAEKLDLDAVWGFDRNIIHQSRPRLHAAYGNLCASVVWLKLGISFAEQSQLGQQY